MPVVSKSTAGAELRSAIIQAVFTLDGFESFVKPGDSVFLKPNFNSADPFPASTDIGFLREVVQLVLEQDPSKVIIGESSAFNDNTTKIMEALGIPQLEDISPKVAVMDLNKSGWVVKRSRQARYLKSVHIPEILDEVDRLVLLPCLKTHHLAQISGSLKLSVAFMQRRERISLHIRRLQQKIADLNSYIHPDLVIMDARKCFINGGPYRGDVREPDLILASTDRVALDVEGIRIIQNYPGNSLEGVEPSEIPQIRESAALGIGEILYTEAVPV